MMPLAMIVMMKLKCVNRWVLALEWDLVLVPAWDLDPAPVLVWGRVLDRVGEGGGAPGLWLDPRGGRDLVPVWDPALVLALVWDLDRVLVLAWDLVLARVLRM